jgi:hypothetical protein
LTDGLATGEVCDGAVALAAELDALLLAPHPASESVSMAATGRKKIVFIVFIVFSLHGLFIISEQSPPPAGQCE